MSPDSGILSIVCDRLMESLGNDSQLTIGVEHVAGSLLDEDEVVRLAVQPLWPRDRAKSQNSTGTEPVSDSGDRRKIRQVSIAQRQANVRVGFA